MAGMLLQGPRIVPRFVRRISLINVSFYNTKVVKSRHIHSLCACGSRSFTQNLDICYSTKVDARKFHTSTVFFDETVIIKSPKFAESITEGDIRWEKAVGDFVQEDEVIGEIETDKTAISVTSPSSGVITELLVSDGDTVTAEQDLVKLTLSGDAPTKKEPASAPETPKPAAPVEKPVPSTASSSSPIPTTPPPPPPIPKAPMSSTPASSVKVTPYIPDTSGARTEKRVKLSRLHQTKARRLKDAQNECAMLTTQQRCDMSSLMELRQSHKETFEKRHGVKLGFMSGFVKAAAYALKNQPIVNAVIDGNDIIYRDYIDISVAVSAPKGLVVPVIRNVEKMGFADIEKTIVELSEKARKSQLTAEDMEGGTFSISNGGVFGSIWGTPIINLPQSAILGMHAIVKRPVAIDNKIVIRPIMNLALTYDHRLIDGREAVTFLMDIKKAVEDPRILLFD